MEVLIHHIEKVQSMYDSFNKGDIPAILKNLSKDCIWEVMGGKEIPYAGIYHGPKDVKGFFEKLAENVDSKEMVVENLFEKGNLVVATGDWKAQVLKTKKPFSTIWSMSFEFNDNGELVHFRDFYDTLKVSKAFAG